MMLREKIEIEYRPIKRVTIIDCTQLSIEELANRVQAMIQMGQPAFLNWAEGVAFLHIPMSLSSEKLVEKYLEGKTVIQSVIFALMPKYSPTIKTKLYDVYVLNQTPSEVYREVAIWLKKYAEFKIIDTSG